MQFCICSARKAEHLEPTIFSVCPAAMDPTHQVEMEDRNVRINRGAVRLFSESFAEASEMIVRKFRTKKHEHSEIKQDHLSNEPGRL